MLDGRGLQDEFQAIRVDTTRAPVYVAHLQGSEGDKDILDFLAFASSLMHAPHALVIVTSPRMPFVSSRQASMYADWITLHADSLRLHQVGLALVLRSALARGAFKAILSMAALPMPHEHFKTEADAVVWARERLRAHGDAR